MFIHCVMTGRKGDRGQGRASSLVAAVEADAEEAGMAGVCVMTSTGTWMADADLFLQAGYQEVDARGRFRLLAKRLAEGASPVLRDWDESLAGLEGWHLLYADQCPWHEKAVRVLAEEAERQGLPLVVRRLETAAEAQRAPSGFGVFALVRDGRLIEDHYISVPRFRNILAKEYPAPRA